MIGCQRHFEEASGQSDSLGAVWPVIFCAADAGLPAAIKSWTQARNDRPLAFDAVEGIEDIRERIRWLRHDKGSEFERLQAS